MFGFDKQLEGIKRQKEIRERQKAGEKVSINEILGREEKVKGPSKREREKARVKELKENHIAYCPKCHSTSIELDRKRLSITRALVGSTFGAGGAILGGLTSKKYKKVCLNCGHKWK